ncbi:protein kinase domain-containing protein [Kitasatospora sp. NPDC001175]|uniref:protein kinase domain-containing protein n=1 Tax=Kitasatospora sp. NPDC001175 TaxID=3157103 RepID=UPI003CFFD586
MKRLGVGGMGEVLLGLAEDGTLAAVKTIRPALLHSPAVRDRFRREIEAVRSVESPCVAQLLDGSAEDEVPWMATEFVPGPTLDHAVAVCGPLPVAVVAGLGVHLASALLTVHTRGLLHRDLKPSNVLLSSTGPKLIDFGIARAMDMDALTATGTVLGTLGFMAPEQVVNARQVVPASDVFSLGAVLVYAATGSGPYGDAPPHVLLHRMANAGTDLSAVPPELHEITAACLRPAADDRPTPAELIVALERIGSFAGWPTEIYRLIEESRSSAQAAALAPVRAGADDRRADASADTEAAGPRRRRIITIAGASAFVLLAGLAAAIHFGSGAGPAASGPAASPPPAATVTGVTESGGPGHNGVFPTSRTGLPSGFHPWSGYLADQPTGCSLGAGTLICRLVDGSLQAIDTANGRQRWRVDLPADPSLLDQPTTADGLRLIPGDGDDPAINGDRVASKDNAGALRIQDLASGRILSTTSFGKDVHLAAEPLADGNRLFLSLCHRHSDGFGCDYTLNESSFDGKQAPWSHQLGSSGPSIATLHNVYGPWAATGRTVYAPTTSGLSSFDEDSGAPTGALSNNCDSLAVPGPTVLCRVADGGLVRAEARSLAKPNDLGGLNPRLQDRSTRVTAADDTVIIAQSPSDGSMMAIDAATGTLRWRIVVDQPHGGQNLLYPTAASAILLDAKAVTMTDTRLLMVPVAPGDATAPTTPTTLPLAKPSGSPGPHAAISSFVEYQHPRLLALGGVLLAVGGDGALHAFTTQG